MRYTILATFTGPVDLDWYKPQASDVHHHIFVLDAEDVDSAKRAVEQHCSKAYKPMVLAVFIGEPPLVFMAYSNINLNIDGTRQPYGQEQL